MPVCILIKTCTLQFSSLFTKGSRFLCLKLYLWRKDVTIALRCKCVLSSQSSSFPWGLVTHRNGYLTELSAQWALVCVLWEKNGQMEMTCLHELLGGAVEQNNIKQAAFQHAHTLGCSQSETPNALLFCSSMEAKTETQKTGLAWADSVHQGR